MIIREAEEKDVGALLLLLAQLGYPTTEKDCIRRIRHYKQDGYKLMAGELDGRCVGFIALHWYNAFHHPRPIGRVVAFCIDEALRSKGLGSKMLSYAEGFFQELNCFKVELTSNLKRKESHEYYFRRGYQQASMHFIKFLSTKTK